MRHLPASLQAPIRAFAFRAEVTKWLALVRLLLSDVPERTELTVPGLATALAPYFQLTNAVRIGDLNAFRQVRPQTLCKLSLEGQHQWPLSVSSIGLSGAIQVCKLPAYKHAGSAAAQQTTGMLGYAGRLRRRTGRCGRGIAHPTSSSACARCGSLTHGDTHGELPLALLWQSHVL